MRCFQLKNFRNAHVWSWQFGDDEVFCTKAELVLDLLQTTQGKTESHHMCLPQTHSLQQRHLEGPGHAAVVVEPESSSAGGGNDTLVLSQLPVVKQSRAQTPARSSEEVGTILCIRVILEKRGEHRLGRQYGSA